MAGAACCVVCGFHKCGPTLAARQLRTTFADDRCGPTYPDDRCGHDLCGPTFADDKCGPSFADFLIFIVLKLKFGFLKLITLKTNEILRWPPVKEIKE